MRLSQDTRQAEAMEAIKIGRHCVLLPITWRRSGIADEQIDAHEIPALVKALDRAYAYAIGIAAFDARFGSHMCHRICTWRRAARSCASTCGR